MELNITEIKKLLNKLYINIIIITHHNPDGDAIGSSLGLYNYLIKKKYKRINILLTSNYRNCFEYLFNIEKILLVNNKYNIIHNLIINADVIFFLDFNNINRIKIINELIIKSKAVKIIIDHHTNIKIKYDFAFYDNKASSTCELVYKLINYMNDYQLIDNNIATCLYTGILTDTNSFRFVNEKSDVFAIAANLIKLGANNKLIYNHIYCSYSDNIIKFLGYCLYKKLNIFNNKISIMSISLFESIQYSISMKDISWIVNYPLYIKKIQLSVLLYEFTKCDDIVKISIRSKGNIHCDAIAAKYFNGGGHQNAAGGIIYNNINESVKYCQKIFNNIIF